jgi:hypothetical protein
MRHAPGRLLLRIVFLLALSLGTYAAEAYSWSATAKQSEPYVNEAVELTFVCRFADEGYQYVIEFAPSEERSAFRMYMLSEKERIIDGKRVNTYRFVLFPQQPGKMEVRFSALMRKTTKASIEQTVIGRDNVEYLDFTDTKADLPVLRFDVRQHQAGLTGDFSLDAQIDKREVRAYEPLHLLVRVEGSGDFDRFVPFDLNISGVQVFAEAPQKSFELSPDGFSGEWLQRFALVAEEDFMLDAFDLDYFDPKSGTLRHLHAPATPIQIRVLPGTAPEALLDDEVEMPSFWQWKRSWLYYALTFAAGVILGLGLKSGASKRAEKEGIAERIKKAGSIKELMTLLALSGEKGFDDLIETIDVHKLQMSLATAKKRALARLDRK